MINLSTPSFSNKKFSEKYLSQVLKKKQIGSKSLSNNVYFIKLDEETLLLLYKTPENDTILEDYESIEYSRIQPDYKAQSSGDPDLLYWLNFQDYNSTNLGSVNKGTNISNTSRLSKDHFGPVSGGWSYSSKLIYEPIVLPQYKFMFTLWYHFDSGDSNIYFKIGFRKDSIEYFSLNTNETGIDISIKDTTDNDLVFTYDNLTAYERKKDYFLACGYDGDSGKLYLYRKTQDGVINDYKEFDITPADINPKLWEKADVEFWGQKYTHSYVVLREYKFYNKILTSSELDNLFLQGYTIGLRYWFNFKNKNFRNLGFIDKGKRILNRDNLELVDSDYWYYKMTPYVDLDNFKFMLHEPIYFSGSYNFTYCLWFILLSVDATAVFGLIPVSANGHNHSHYIRLDIYNHVISVRKNGETSVNVASFSYTWESNKLYFAAVKYDSYNEKIHLYINNTSNFHEFYDCSFSTVKSILDLELGFGVRGESGYVCDVKIYNQTLSDSQIDEIYWQGIESSQLQFKKDDTYYNLIQAYDQNGNYKTQTEAHLAVYQKKTQDPSKPIIPVEDTNYNNSLLVVDNDTDVIKTSTIKEDVILTNKILTVDSNDQIKKSDIELNIACDYYGWRKITSNGDYLSVFVNPELSRVETISKSNGGYAGKIPFEGSYGIHGNSPPPNSIYFEKRGTHYIALTEDNKIFRFIHGVDGIYIDISDGIEFKSFSIGSDETLWAIDTAQKIYKRNATDDGWDMIASGAGNQISVANSNYIYIIGTSSAGDIYFWDGNSWMLVSNTGLGIFNKIQFSIGQDGIFYIVSDDYKLYKYSGRVWNFIRGNVKQVSYNPPYLAILNTSDNIEVKYVDELCKSTVFPSGNNGIRLIKEDDPPTTIDDPQSQIIIGGYEDSIFQARDSVSIGFGLVSGTTGNTYRNVTIGPYAKTDGPESIAIGSFAEAKNQITIAIGFEARISSNALCSLTVGSTCHVYSSYGICFGRRADIYSNSEYAIAIGTSSKINENCTHSIAIGRESEVHINCIDCIAIGYKALSGKDDGTARLNCISIGRESSGCGTNSISIGYKAWCQSSDENHIAIGNNAYALNDNNVSIGHNSGRQISTHSNMISLYSNADSSGNAHGVFIKTTTTGVAPGGFGMWVGYQQKVMNSKDNDGYALNVNGSISYNGSITNVSDERLKNNIKSLTHYSLKDILKLNPVEFTWKDDTENKEQYGLIAQEVEEFIPELVNVARDEYKGIDYIRLIPMLIKSIQEQNDMIQKLQNQIDELKNNNV